MAIRKLTPADRKKVKAQFVRPSRATAAACTKSGNASVIGMIDVALGSMLNHRSNVYALVVDNDSPGPDNVSIELGIKPNIGDIAFVYVMNTVTNTDPRGLKALAIYVYGESVNAASGASYSLSGSPKWRRLTMDTSQ